MGIWVVQSGLGIVSSNGQLVVRLGTTGLLQDKQAFVLLLRTLLEPVASLGEETTGNRTCGTRLPGRSEVVPQPRGKGAS